MELNQILCGESRETLAEFTKESIDLVVTDPPYLCGYKDRAGCTVANDTNEDAVLSVFDEIYRVMKSGSYCISFYGWNSIDKFSQKWAELGFKTVGHFTWAKRYASSIGYTKHQSECAFLLVKGNPKKPNTPISNVQPWQYTGNKIHPTEKAVGIISPLIQAFSKKRDVVLDPFAGSGSTVVSAALNDRNYIGIELEEKYCDLAKKRLAGVEYRRAGG